MTVLKRAPSFVPPVDGSRTFQLSALTILVCSLVLVFVCSCLLHTWQKVFSLGGIPKSIPWAGIKDAGNGPLSRARATLRSFFGMRELIQDGYNKYSKNDQAFVLPNLIHGPEVILPPSQMRWLLEQPDNVLSQHEVNRLIISADTTLLHKNITQEGNVIHRQVIQREMTRGQDSYTNDMIEEIEEALGRSWGYNTQGWEEVKVFDTMIDLISRVVCRVLVGLPLCRDEEYLQSARTFGRNVVLISYFENLLIPLLRPILVPLAMSYDMFHYRRIAKFISPIVKERMTAFQKGEVYKKPDKSEPNDYVQWALHYAFASKDLLERTPELIMKRLAALGFAATHSPGVIISNVLFDIISSPSAKYLQQVIRTEVYETTARHPGKEWTKASLSQMTRIDSMIRESLRLNAFSARAISKKVMAPQGIDLPSGEHLPYGVMVGITASGTHYDNSVYPNADTYEPFRFSDLPNIAEADKSTGKVDRVLKKPSPMVSTSDDYLAFSHGSHACPGRFFASHLLKCILAQIALKYEIEPIDKRPENVWFNNLIGPPMWSTLRVRRRTVKPDSATSSIVAIRDDKEKVTPT